MPHLHEILRGHFKKCPRYKYFNPEAIVYLSTYLDLYSAGFLTPPANIVAG